MSEAVTKKPREKRVSALVKHKNGDCGCSVDANPQNCVYQKFRDGWDFQPDVGNGQKRGEVFTPRFIVDKMVADVGIATHKAVYEQDYTSDDIEVIREKISAKVLEPAVGTANYLSSVLWHKIQYAYALTRKELEEDSENGRDYFTSTIALERYQQHVLTAVSSVYAFDIDVGNIEVTKRRLIGSAETHINDTTIVNYWTTVLLSELSQGDETIVRSTVQNSLDEAETHWQRFLVESPKGVLGYLYKKHTNEDVPEDFLNACKTILEQNIRCFNGIEKEDNGAVPGWKNVVWSWWLVGVEEDSDYTVSSFSELQNFGIRVQHIRLADQMLQGEYEQLERRVERFQNDHMQIVHNGSLFPVSEWDSEKNQKEFMQMQKRLTALRKELEAIGGSQEQQ